MSVHDFDWGRIERAVGLTPKPRKPRKRTPERAVVDELREKVATGTLGGETDGAAA